MYIYIFIIYIYTYYIVLYINIWVLILRGICNFNKLTDDRSLTFYR